jgi:hypothetical protein
MKTEIIESEIKYYLNYLLDFNLFLYDYWNSFFYNEDNQQIKSRWNAYNLNQMRGDISFSIKVIVSKSN